METKNDEQKRARFICEICDYNTYKNCDYVRHLTTRKHLARHLETNGDKKRCANIIIYECVKCNYTTNCKSNYNRHLITEKHKKNFYRKGKETKHICILCNKEYMNYRGLLKHKKTCVSNQETTTPDTPDTPDTPEVNDNIEILQNTFVSGNVISKDIFTPQLFMEVLKQSKELQEVLVEQNKELQNKLLEKENQLLEQNKEYHKEIIELTKKQTTNINTQNNNTNQQFNLHFFLNETCKDAMNIKDFINSLKLTTDDFETTGKLGFVDGISRIFIKELNKIETEKLPVHCTDVKRGTVYIKDNDIWEKENNEKQKLKWTIDRIAELNLHQHGKWQEKYPVCRENNTDENQYFFKLTSVALGGRGKEEQDKYREKIMRNVMKEIVLDKQTVVLK
jgi:hypothetical protein